MCCDVSILQAMPRVSSCESSLYTYEYELEFLSIQSMMHHAESLLAHSLRRELPTAMTENRTLTVTFRSQPLLRGTNRA